MSGDIRDFARDMVGQLRGSLVENRALADLSWLKTGGDADWFFMPQDREDLALFLRALPDDMPLFTMGLGSNLIIRDGGVRGVTIRLGRAFAGYEVKGDTITAGAALIDSMLAKRAAKDGFDLGFLRTIPGCVGGAVAMNAGCYGRYMADVLVDVEIMTRDGEIMTLPAEALEFAYRKSHLPKDAIILSARLRTNRDEPEWLEAAMAQALQKREQTQPVNDRTCGSTFRNPVGYSSTGKDDDRHELKAWKVIEDAGLRGARLGGAEMNEMHPNFLTNRDNATSYELEALGELVRKKVKAHSGIELTWEIRRMGDFLPEQDVDWVIED